MKSRSNLYQDASGNSIAGRYIYSRKNGEKFYAYLKYPEGYCKSGVFYSFDDAVSWVETNYETYRPGWYMDNGQVIVLRRPGEPKPERLY